MKETFLHYKSIQFVGLFLLICALGGCVVKDMGNVVKHSMKGQHYLSNKDFSRGVESFQAEVEANPESALANYYYGRFLLGDEQYKKALGYLKKAQSLGPEDIDYNFWLGVAYGVVGKKVSERKQYLKVLSLDKKHLQALTYLGHNQLESNEYTKALQNYAKALDIWPASPSALYNRALIATKFGRKPEAKVGWLDYLYYYPSGAMARRAVDHLNILGDFSYRNYTLLSRTVTLEKIYFEPFKADIVKSSRASLSLIGVIFNNMQRGKLQIVVYQLKNKKMAKQRALSIRKYLLKEYPEIKKENIGVSWFASPESLRVQKKNKKIDESVSFFVTM